MMNFQSVCLTSLYLAPVQYYVQFLRNIPVTIEQNDNYTKQTYRNRCVILDASGPISLTIPTVSNSGRKAKMKDMQISEHNNWQHVHWNAIKSAYNSSPFFEYYYDDFYPFYHSSFKYLFDFNEQLREKVLNLLNISSSTVDASSEYVSLYEPNILDLREVILSKNYLNSLDNSYTFERYYQVFGEKHGFVPNLSIIDLLFNMGNESLLILHKSLLA